MLDKILKESNYTVVFTGAGMSTESGVSDFRSKNGLWSGKNPQWLASRDAMANSREEFVEFYRKRMEALKGITPHTGYDILTEWGKRGLVQSIITQNTDGLHEQVENPNVITLHGTIQKLHCDHCKQEYSTENYFMNELICSCGGFIRPSVILFGESLDTKALHLAERESERADLFIVLGSSLVVSPANSFPLIAKERGAKLVIVNNDPTPLDEYADLVVNERKIGDVLREVNEKLK